MKKTIGAAIAAALALMLAAFTGAALAGNGQGGGHGSTGADHAQAQPQQVQTGGDNAQGVKPGKTTAHGTYAQAGSSHTKSYGNGKTAGQIAEQHGASPSTVLHGPGNSQPHKAALCPGGHERDVHALRPGGACGQQAQQQQQHMQKHRVEQVQQQSTHEVKSVSSEQKTHSPEQSKVYICHATGSATNPYVLVHVSKHALAAHTAHQDGRDVVLGDSAGKGCPEAAQAQAPARQSTPSCAASTDAKSFTEHDDDVVVKTECNQVASTQATTPRCTQTITATVPGGVWHRTGSSTNPYVFIHPSGSSAHYSRHADDVVVPAITKTEIVQAACSQSTAAVAGTQAVQSVVTESRAAQTQAIAAAKAEEQAQQPAPQSAAQRSQPQQQPTGGVRGAQATLPQQATAAKAKPHGGVLGAQATLPPRHHGLLGTVASATLPFTGLPLWPVVLGAVALIMAGIAVRRTQRGTTI